MIRLDAVEMEGESSAGKFYGRMTFGPGLQVITAPNSYGKSLAAKCLPWALGVEPLFGITGKGDLSCFPLAAREELLLPGAGRARVLWSRCAVELTHADGRRLTLRREIKGDPATIAVEETTASGATRKSKLFARTETMQSEHAGFQRFFFEWMGWPRMPVTTFRATESEVYLENLAPLFFIEQDEGWTDLQARQITRYGQQQIAQVAVEYLLGATDALAARHREQVAHQAAVRLREEARRIGEAVVTLGARNGWELGWSGAGSVTEVLERWTKESLDDVMGRANIDLRQRVAALGAEALVLRKELTSGPVDSADMSAHRASSQRAIEIKQRKHERAEELHTLRAQEQEERVLLESLEHRIRSASDVLRLKESGVGRLEEVECPTCHRELEVSTFALRDQSAAEVSGHIEGLKRDRDLMRKSLRALASSIVAVVSEIERLEAEFREAERALATVTSAVGPVRERLAEIASRLTAVEREIDRTHATAAEASGLQRRIDEWVASAKGLERAPATTSLGERKAAFEREVHAYLEALGHSAVRDAAGRVQLDEQYVPYLERRRVMSLGSASDRSRLVAAYTLALAAAARQVDGLHPGLVVLDEPIQQNPDAMHKDLLFAFLGKELAQGARFQTILLTYLLPQECEQLMARGVHVQVSDRPKFLQLVES